MKPFLGISIFSLLLLTFIGCNTDSEKVSRLSDVPVTVVDELIRFDTVGETPLSYLGIVSFVLDDGSILLPDWQQVKLFKTNTSGDLIEAIGRRGNGPGELQDITIMSQSAFGDIVIYDQMTHKVTVQDNQGHYKTEFLISPDRPSGSIREIYEVGQQQYLLMIQANRFFIEDESEQLSNLVIYNTELDSFSPASTIRSRPYARSGGSGVRVPYAAADLVAYDKSSANIYMYGSNGNTIAKLDASLDTLQVITFELEPEILTIAESDTLQEEYSDFWESMQTILPEYKALADQMMIDQNQYIWLKLNHMSDYDQWLIVSDQGELIQVIQLPKDSWLTHISEHHLGVRLDEATFALYEYPESLN